MRTITYNLRPGQEHSDAYYQHINRFASQVYQFTEDQLGHLITGITSFTISHKPETLRSRAEYAVELLTLGMTWDRYLGASQQTPAYITELLKHLYRLRNENAALKPRVDDLRGTLNAEYMIPFIGIKAANKEPNAVNFDRLMNWLAATGEFKDEVKRMRIWFQFFTSNTEYYTIADLERIAFVFNWFRTTSKQELGIYTTGLGTFLQTDYKSYGNREDVIFCGKEEVEYHLNMVGSEIMNRGFAASYHATTRKTLLVPGCLRPANGENCQSNQKGTDISCTHCNPECRIHHLNMLGKQHGFNVFIVPHSSTFTQWLKRWENSTETGLIAVACLLNLVPGGYEMRELNIPAQCLLLDFCGCRKHWDAEGIPTEINENRLLELVYSKSQVFSEKHA